MPLERDRLIEILVAVPAIGIMLALLYYIGVTYGGENGALTEEGGMVLVGAIVLFILLLTVVGVVLAFVLNDPEEEDGTEGGSDGADSTDSVEPADATEEADASAA